MQRHTHMKKANVTISTTVDEWGMETAVMFDDRGWVIVEHYTSENSASFGHDRWCKWAQKYSRPQFLEIVGINKRWSDLVGK
jgi:hypothetical protein